MKPKDLLRDLAERAAMRIPERITYGGPGTMIAGLPDEQRAVLRDLRSDDAQDVRPLWTGGPFVQSGWARRHYGRGQT